MTARPRNVRRYASLPAARQRRRRMRQALPAAIAVLGMFSLAAPAAAQAAVAGYGSAPVSAPALAAGVASKADTKPDSGSGSSKQGVSPSPPLRYDGPLYRAPAPSTAKLVGPAGVPGIDVSAYQHNVDWAAQSAAGIKFSYVLATEGNYATNKYFQGQYSGAQDAGLLVGSYHFANPAVSTGSVQAQYYVDHDDAAGSAEGNTLPPMLDMEDDPYNNDTCYQLTPAQMVTWIRSYTSTLALLTGQLPVIYTTNKWWTKCTANSVAFNNQPLFLAKYDSKPGTIPKAWNKYTFWQYSQDTPASAPQVVGDLDVFNGSLSALHALAATAPAKGVNAAVNNPLYPPVPPPLAATIKPAPLLFSPKTAKPLIP